MIKLRFENISLYSHVFFKIKQKPYFHLFNFCSNILNMVNVAQLVEPRIVVPVVVGSSPIVHPIIIMLFIISGPSGVGKGTLITHL